jgi:hypothetical protein
MPEGAGNQSRQTPIRDTIVPQPIESSPRRGAQRLVAWSTAKKEFGGCPRVLSR